MIQNLPYWESEDVLEADFILFHCTRSNTGNK